MEELIFTPSDGIYVAEFVSGTVSILQYAATKQPKQIDLYCRIDDSLDWVLLGSLPKPPIASIWALDIPADINVRLVADVPFDKAYVRLS